MQENENIQKEDVAVTYDNSPATRRRRQIADNRESNAREALRPRSVRSYYGIDVDGNSRYYPSEYDRAHPYGCACLQRFTNENAWADHMSICAVFAEVAKGTIFEIWTRKEGTTQ